MHRIEISRSVLQRLRRWATSGVAGAGVALALVGCGAAEDADSYSVRGVLLDTSSCGVDSQKCDPKPLSGAEVCAEENCVKTGERGAFDLGKLPAPIVSLDHPGGGRDGVVLAFVGSRRGDVSSPVRDVELHGRTLRVRLAPDFDVDRLDLSTVKAVVRPYGFDADTSDADGAGVIGAVTREEAGSVTIQVERFPLAGEGWVLSARTTPCDTCARATVELARLSGAALSKAAMPPAARAEMTEIAAGSFRMLAPSTEAVNAIAAKYTALGGKNGALGAAIAPVEDAANGGAKRRYLNGTIYFTRATGAMAVWGIIQDKYVLWGSEGGALGYPISDELPAPDGVGRFSFFQAGAIYWTPATGARVVYGAIALKWGELGWERGFLRYPTSDSTVAPDGVGVYSFFQGGAIYWTQATGAREVHGEILNKWAALGWERSPLGYPTSDETATADKVGRFNRFQSGSIYYTPSTGAKEVHGAIHTKWAALGYETSLLGYPTSDESRTPDGVGRYNHFVSGSIYWTQATGAQSVRGIIRDKWARWGWEKSALGYPTRDEYSRGNGVWANDFQNGRIDSKLHQPQMFKVFTQNMAFLVAPASYLGQDCDIKQVTGSFGQCGALDALIAFLKREKPDVVGLQEMFDQQAVDYLLADREILGMYPHRMQGPDEDVIFDLGGSDGGLLLLSRHPIVDSDRIIYRKCADEDCLAAKGVLYAQIEPAPGVRHDVFVSHTQNPDAGGTDDSLRETQDQLEMFGSYVEAKRGTRQFPAIIMGDLNIDGLRAERYSHMIQALGNPIDTWSATNTGLGITHDDNRSFRQIDPDPKHLSGQRLDYILLQQGERLELPLYASRVIAERSPRGWDISDHYGVMTTFSYAAREADVIYTGPVSNVTARLRRFHCFEVTDGTLDHVTPGDNDDEVEWTLGLRIDSGTRTTSRSGRANDIGEHKNFWFASPPTTNRGPMGNTLTFDVKGEEVDDACVLGACVETGRVSLGTRSLSLTREQLFEALHQPMFYGLGMFRGDNSEYMGTVEVTATR